MSLMQEQLTTLNSVTSRHAESCTLKLFGYKWLITQLILLVLFITGYEVVNRL